MHVCVRLSAEMSKQQKAAGGTKKAPTQLKLSKLLGAAAAASASAASSASTTPTRSRSPSDMDTDDSTASKKRRVATTTTAATAASAAATPSSPLATTTVKASPKQQPVFPLFAKSATSEQQQPPATAPSDTTTKPLAHHEAKPCPLVGEIGERRRELFESVAAFRFNKKRVRVLSAATSIPENSNAILYWMSRDQRVEDNWALVINKQNTYIVF